MFFQQSNSKKLIKIFDWLYKTDYEYPFIYNSYKTNAYLIIHKEGNILLYNSSKLKNYEEHIKKLGGIKYFYLSHHHEAGGNAKYMYETFGCKTTISKLEEFLYPGSKKYYDTSLKEGNTHNNTFRILYTPGHTIGSFCFIYQHNEINLIFTGDSLVLNKHKKLIAPVPYVDDKKQLAKSLARLKNIQTPLYVCGSGSFADVQYQRIEEKEIWETQLNNVIQSLS